MEAHCDDAAAIGACAQASIHGFPNRHVNGTRLPLPWERAGVRGYGLSLVRNPSPGLLRNPTSPMGEVALCMPQQCAALVSHDHRGADGDAAVEIGHVFIGHAEASR